MMNSESIKKYKNKERLGYSHEVSYNLKTALDYSSL